MPREEEEVEEDEIDGEEVATEILEACKLRVVEVETGVLIKKQTKPLGPVGENLLDALTKTIRANSELFRENAFGVYLAAAAALDGDAFMQVVDYFADDEGEEDDDPPLTVRGG